MTDTTTPATTLPTKSAVKSVGIMGPAIGLIVFAANRKWPGLGLTDADVSPIIEAASEIFTGLTAIYGRWKATHQVTLMGAPKPPAPAPNSASGA